nr:hypothetical protein BaRGS_025635 [Batillaria attramentaria]
MGGNTGAIIGGLLGFLVIILVIIIVVIAVKKIRKRAAVVKRDQQPNNLYPLGGTERVLMRPVASLAVTDPLNMMNSTGCHVIRDLATDQVDFIPDEDYRSCFHPVLSSHMEGDDVMDDYTQAFAVPAEDQPNRR